MISKRNRLDRFLSKKLQRPMRQVKGLLAGRLVTVDGAICHDGGRMIDEFSHVVCQGDVLQNLTPVYLMLHKPAGTVSATRDEVHTTVLDLIDHPLKDTLHLVGRLDRFSTGLVLLTNDGRWSRRLTEPETKVDKVYQVRVEREISEEYISAFAQGMYFAYENVTTAPVRLTITGRHEAELVLTEGRYHQIKRMFGRFRNPVVNLHRVKIGSLTLDDTLPAGAWRALTATEVQALSDGTRV